MARSNGVSSRELFILGLISSGPTYGHEIMTTLRLSEAHRWVELSDKHVYYVLRKLAREGWVEERRERVGHTPPRKVYEITAEGRVALRRMLRSEALTEVRAYHPFDTALAVLGTTDAVDPDAALDTLRDRLVALRERQTQEFPEDDDDRAVLARFGGAAFALARRHRRMLDAEIEWLAEVVAFVEQKGWEAMRVPADAAAER